MIKDVREVQERETKQRSELKPTKFVPFETSYSLRSETPSSQDHIEQLYLCRNQEMVL